MKYIIIISLMILAFGCYKPSDYDPQVNNPSFLSIVPKKSVVPANGAFIDTLIIELPLNSSADKRTVTLRVDSGLFIPSDSTKITISAFNTDPKYPGKLIAYAVYQSPLQAGSATITGMVQNNTTNTNLKLTVDTATKIDVQADKLFITNYVETNITATLSKSKSGVGRPTTGQQVYFLASKDSLGKTLSGYFRAIRDTTDVTETATAIYAADTSYKGQLYVIAKFARGVKDTISSKFLIIKN